MKQHIEVIKDSFMDYAGKEHHFVIAAVSDILEDENSAPIVIKSESMPNYFIIGVVTKGIRLGISICNPEDTFDEKVGVLAATGRAMKNKNYALYATNKGYINTKLVKALLEQEANFLKNNPELYIKGYKEAKDRYFKNREMLNIKEGFSDVEKTIVKEVEKNSKFLDNVNKYLSIIQKCKKHGK